jgi:hypothetical protein
VVFVHGSKIRIILAAALPNMNRTGAGYAVCTVVAPIGTTARKPEAGIRIDLEIEIPVGQFGDGQLVAAFPQRGSEDLPVTGKNAVDRPETPVAFPPDLIVIVGPAIVAAELLVDTPLVRLPTADTGSCHRLLSFACKDSRNDLQIKTRLKDLLNLGKMRENPTFRRRPGSVSKRFYPFLSV